MTPASFTIGLIQAQALAGREENLERAGALVEQAAQRGAQVVCLQELFAGPYFCQT